MKMGKHLWASVLELARLQMCLSGLDDRTEKSRTLRSIEADVEDLIGRLHDLNKEDTRDLNRSIKINISRKALEAVLERWNLPLPKGRRRSAGEGS